MNALPLISHRLLVAAVVERSGVRNRATTGKKSIIIECDATASVSSWDVDKAAVAPPIIIAHHYPTPAVAGVVWPV
jgi:hypothetical protein